mgnify:CR=1 FL=1
MTLYGLEFNQRELDAIREAKPYCDACRSSREGGAMYKGVTAERILNDRGIGLDYERGWIRYHHIVGAISRRKGKRGDNIRRIYLK